MNTDNIVQKLWNCCNALRGDGMSYGDYLEQLTNLMFLKMAESKCLVNSYWGRIQLNLFSRPSNLA